MLTFQRTETSEERYSKIKTGRTDVEMTPVVSVVLGKLLRERSSWSCFCTQPSHSKFDSKFCSLIQVLLHLTVLKLNLTCHVFPHQFLKPPLKPNRLRFCGYINSSLLWWTWLLVSHQMSDLQSSQLQVRRVFTKHVGQHLRWLAAIIHHLTPGGCTFPDSPQRHLNPTSDQTN